EAVLYYERGGRGTGAEIRAGAEQDGVYIVDHLGEDQQTVYSGCEAKIKGGGCGSAAPDSLRAGQDGADAA
ncbi:MAG: hypothetical protein ACK53Y_27705, partial [bacterium]